MNHSSRQSGALAMRVLIAIAFTVAAAFAIACGSSDPASTVTPIPPTPTEVAEAPAPTSTPPNPEPIAFEDLPRREDADLAGIDAWLNTEPTTIANETSKGNVVLIDFWTYTCVNCLRTLPFLQEWHEKYADLGLVILGVHAPEFEFEKNLANVQRAVDEEGVNWPVALDNEMETWDAFKNRYWPAKWE